MAAKSASTKGSTTLSKKPKVHIAGDALPRKTLEEALRVAQTLYDTAGKDGALWDELAGYMKLSPRNPDFKYLVWSAQAYGIVAKAEDKKLSVAETGRKIIAPNDDTEKEEALRKAVLTPTILSKFFTDYNGRPIPSSEHFANVLQNKLEVPPDRATEAINLILANGKVAGVLDFSQSQAQPIVHLDSSAPSGPIPTGDGGAETPTAEAGTPAKIDWAHTVFYITPIGDDGTDIRKHADMMLKHLIDPVCKQFGLSAVRADKIAKSGLISQQILEHLAYSRLCIADLSFGNPNAFYELGVRHVCKLPTVQVIRKGDRIPFDVSQGRTITVETSDVYTIMDKFESARRELTEHVRSLVIEAAASAGDDNPVSAYLPALRVTFVK